MSSGVNPVRIQTLRLRARVETRTAHYKQSWVVMGIG
jgi:hypothetical protein